MIANSRPSLNSFSLDLRHPGRSLGTRAVLEGLCSGLLVGILCLLTTPWIEMAALSSAIAGLLASLRVYGQSHCSDKQVPPTGHCT